MVIVYMKDEPKMKWMNISGKAHRFVRSAKVWVVKLLLKVDKHHSLPLRCASIQWSTIHNLSKWIFHYFLFLWFYMVSSGGHNDYYTRQIDLWPETVSLNVTGEACADRDVVTAGGIVIGFLNIEVKNIEKRDGCGGIWKVNLTWILVLVSCY